MSEIDSTFNSILDADADNDIDIEMLFSLLIKEKFSLKTPLQMKTMYGVIQGMFKKDAPSHNWYSYDGRELSGALPSEKYFTVTPSLEELTTVNTAFSRIKMDAKISALNHLSVSFKTPDE